MIDTRSVGFLHKLIYGFAGVLVTIRPFRQEERVARFWDLDASGVSTFYRLVLIATLTGAPAISESMSSVLDQIPAFGESCSRLINHEMTLDLEMIFFSFLKLSRLADLLGSILDNQPGVQDRLNHITQLEFAFCSRIPFLLCSCVPHLHEFVIDF